MLSKADAKVKELRQSLDRLKAESEKAEVTCSAFVFTSIIKSRIILSFPCSYIYLSTNMLQNVRCLMFSLSWIDLGS